MTATPGPKTDRPEPPKKPPTTTATGMADNAAFGLVVPIPPGWQVGALELVPTHDSGMKWQRTLRTHAVDSCGLPVSRAFGDSPVPAHATALAIKNAWGLYLSEHPSGTEAAAQAGCRVPHPEPAAGIRTKTTIRVGEKFPIQVTLPNSLTLTGTVPELVRLDGNKPPAWHGAAAETITEHGIFSKPRPSDAAADVDQMRDFLKGRRPVPLSEPVRGMVQFDLEAVAQDWDGNFRPLAELIDPTPPELRGAIVDTLRPTWVRLPQGFVTRVDVDSHTGAVPCTVCRWQAVIRTDGPPPLVLDSTRYPAVSKI